MTSTHGPAVEAFFALHEGPFSSFTRGEGKMWYEDDEEEDEGRCSGHTMHNSSRSRGSSSPSSLSEIDTPEMETVMLMSTPISSPPMTNAQPPALAYSCPTRCRSGACDLPRNLYEAAPGLLGMGSPTCTDHIRNLHHHYNVLYISPPCFSISSSSAKLILNCYIIFMQHMFLQRFLSFTLNSIVSLVLFSYFHIFRNHSSILCVVM